MHVTGNTIIRLASPILINAAYGKTSVLWGLTKIWTCWFLWAKKIIFKHTPAKYVLFLSASHLRSANGIHDANIIFNHSQSTNVYANGLNSTEKQIDLLFKAAAIFSYKKAERHIDWHQIHSNQVVTKALKLVTKNEVFHSFYIIDGRRCKWRGNKSRWNFTRWK